MKMFVVFKITKIRIQKGFELIEQGLVLNSLSYLGRTLASYQVDHMTYQVKIKVIWIISILKALVKISSTNLWLADQSENRIMNLILCQLQIYGGNFYHDRSRDKFNTLQGF